MYVELAKAEDEKMVDQWKGDADGILIFVSAKLRLLFPQCLRKHRLVYSLLLSLYC